MFKNIKVLLLFSLPLTAAEQLLNKDILNSTLMINNIYDDFHLPYRNLQRKNDLVHVHLQESSIFGNSTALQYFYVNVYFGSQKEKQSLIVDTGSSIVAIPCKNYCLQKGHDSCGRHINDWYDFDSSTSKYLYNCKTDKGCTCTS